MLSAEVPISSLDVIAFILFTQIDQMDGND